MSLPAFWSVTMAIPEPKIEHIWQDFRIKCLDFAVRTGVSASECVSAAKIFESYILTPSEREKKQVSTEQ